MSALQYQSGFVSDNKGVCQSNFKAVDCQARVSC